jgi:hypothetical protein
MCKALLYFLFFLATACGRAQQQGPQPRVVEPGAEKPPSDAVVLFDGADLSKWRRGDGQPPGCTVDQGVMVCRTGAGDIVSTETFSSAQIHLEYMVPHMPDQKDQLRGNSGVFVHGCYEVQILDSFQNPTYPDGANGAVYGFSPPLVNASRPPEQWQTYDMIFHPPVCDAAGNISTPGSLTVFLNGVLVQDRVRLDKPGPGCTHRRVCEPGPLRLQDHSGFPGAPDTTMKFRNIWFRRLEPGSATAARRR